MHDVRFCRPPGCGRDPIPASRDALGTLPMRAVRYCEAVTLVSGFGGYLFPETDVSLRWDGSRIFYQPDWQPVADGVGFPGPYAAFLGQAPDNARAVQ
jgi:hypothetical protein